MRRTLLNANCIFSTLMCGIVGYIGNREAQDILVKGLSRLEYRGYDSAGIAIVNGHLAVRKKEGKIARLSDDLNGNGLAGKLGIGHTRWATHGPPSDLNAHPHVSTDGSFALVHNHDIHIQSLFFYNPHKPHNASNIGHRCQEF